MMQTQNIRRRLISLLLTIVMVLGMLPTMAFGAENDTWTQVDLQNIQETDTIAVTMTTAAGVTYALPNAKATNAGPTAVIVTVNNTTMTGDSAALGWHIKAVVGGGYTLQSAADETAYLYTIASNSGVRVSTTQATWSVSANYLSTTDSNNAVRYLGVYTTNPDWRAYTSTTSNIKDQTLAFYKLNNGGTPVVETKAATPSINPATGPVIGATKITLTCATEGADIYYTTDGTGPTTESTLYSSPFTVNPTAETPVTVKAMAVKSSLSNSEVSSATYTLLTKSNISAALEGETGATFLIEGVVTFIDGKNLYLQDSTGAIVAYCADTPTGIVVGDTVRAQGSKKVYNGLPELNSATVEKVGTGTLFTPEEISLTELTTNPSSYLCKRVKLAGLTLGAASGNNTVLSDGSGNTINMYKCPTLTAEVGSTVTVTATVGIYNSLQLRVASVDDVEVTAEPVVVQTPVISPNGGAVSGETAVTLSCGTDGATIYYTTDGTAPTTESTPYSTPFAVTPAAGTPVTVKAIAVKTGRTDSTVATCTFTYAAPVAAPISTGDAVVIYNSAFGRTLSGVQSGFYNASTTVTVSGGAVTGYSADDIWTVQENDNGTFSFLHDGKKISLDTSYTSMPYDKVNDKWTLKDAGNGLYYIENAGRAGLTMQYQDSYKTWSAYATITEATKANFAVGLFKVVDTDAPVVTLGDRSNAQVGTDYVITADITDNVGVTSAVLTYTIGGVSHDLTMGKNSAGRYEATVPASAFTAGMSTFTFAVTAKDAKNNTAATQPQTVSVDDLPQAGAVTPEKNASTGSNKRPIISLTYANAGTNPSVSMKLDGQSVTPTDKTDVKAAYTPAADLADGAHTVVVTVTRQDGKSATVTWSFTVGQVQYQHYFGQLHAHTTYSDGSGTLDTALNYVKNLPESANVDFVAFTDHSNYFDKSGAANPEAALYDLSQMTAASKATWEEYTGAMDAFNAANNGVIALGGFEMTWSGGPGHINTFNTPGLVSRNNTTLNNKTNDAGMKAYYALLDNANLSQSISQFNHPGTTFGTFSDFAYWDAMTDTRIQLVEVGNGEGAIGAGGYYPSYEYYTMALDKGWHVAPSNNQDNHKGKWGDANNARDVILADALSEDALYEAIRNYRVYSTEDKNLVIDYTLNDQLMGSVLEEVPQTVSIQVNVSDPDRDDAISKVEVIVNSGKTAYTWSDSKLDSGSLSCQLPISDTVSYYYIRVTQADGDLAVTAPVWVGETTKIGISSVACGTSTPVTNEALTLTTTLFNSESKTAYVKSLVYTVNGQVIGQTDTTGMTVPSSGTLAVDFQNCFTAARRTTVTVTAVLTVGDEELTFTQDIQLDIQDASKLIYIGIDASHYNEYVAGNYKDSMGNFGTLAAGYNVRTVELKTSQELISACANTDGKYKAILLTAPSRRLTAAQSDPKTYSENELTALSNFNAGGGAVILAGWSDNYENYTAITGNSSVKHMAETQNDILEALGSSLRISDDATYDDVRAAADGVDKWRLYFNTYPSGSFLTDGVIYDADHPYDRMYTEVFSHYGGASIYAVNSAGTATSTLPATIQPVVYGHSSTYSVDVDKDGKGGATIPKYAYAPSDDRLLVMATEQLDGKGLIVVSGAAFMSNFEVQATLDNGQEQNYSNYRICENLVSYLNPTEISTIAQVQGEPSEGVKFTIEGVVTSNASGYDQDSAFFDCIYLQDDTAGINAFPVSGNYKIGDRVRITGTTSSYQGERQIAVTESQLVSGGSSVNPKVITAKQLNDGDVLGSLVTLSGTVTSFQDANGLTQTIMVKDAAGNTARVFIDGYITTDKTIANLSVGTNITVTGLASYDNTFNAPNGPFPRIRVRDRADVVCTAAGGVSYPWDGDTDLKLAVISDSHIYDGEQLGTSGSAFQNYLNGDRKMLVESQKIFTEAVSRIEASDAQVVLICGDLTKDGEALNHSWLKKQLTQLEAAGKQIYIINGNHDLSNADALSYSGDITEKTDTVDMTAFRSNYAAFGYDEAVAKDTASLSYAVDLGDKYRLIAIDDCLYNNSLTNPAQTTGGSFDGSYDSWQGEKVKNTLNWVLTQIQAARQAGRIPIGMMHHGLVAHNAIQPTFFGEYLTKDNIAVATQLADAGMSLVFTGHFHAQDAAKLTTDAGNILYDVETGSLETYPSPIRWVALEGKEVTYASTHIDSVANLTVGDLSASELASTLSAGFPTYSYAYLMEGLEVQVPGILTSALINQGMEPSAAAAASAGMATSKPFAASGIDTVKDMTLSTFLATCMAFHYAGDETNNTNYTVFSQLVAVLQNSTEPVQQLLGDVAWALINDTTVDKSSNPAVDALGDNDARFTLTSGKPASGSSSSNDSSSKPSGSTTANSDGSTTTTTTNQTTGAVTKVTIGKDGGKIETVTQTDGFVKETVAAANGMQSTAEMKADGTAKITASVPAKTVTDAVAKGEAVTVETAGGSVVLPAEVAQSIGNAAVTVNLTVTPAASGNAIATVTLSVTAGGKAVTGGTVSINIANLLIAEGRTPLADGTGEATPQVTMPGIVAMADEKILFHAYVSGDELIVPATMAGTLTVVDNTKTFDDVSTNHWANTAVGFVAARGLFAGSSDSTFSPDDTMTRAMLMMVLARLDGQDTTGGSVWYEKGMNWAVVKGISDGTNPNGAITREQLAVMLWRYAGSPTTTGNLNRFTDRDQVASFAVNALEWAVEQGILAGTGNGSLSPKGAATRAQVATMLMRFCL